MRLSLASAFGLIVLGVVGFVVSMVLLVQRQDLRAAAVLLLGGLCLRTAHEFAVGGHGA
jgi:hypothetical protein